MLNTHVGAKGQGCCCLFLWFGGFEEYWREGGFWKGVWTGVCIVWKESRGGEREVLKGMF